MGYQMIKMLPDYGIRLRTYLAEHRTEPFEWGKNDCMLFVADCIERMTGVDVAESLRGAYSDEQGARDVIKSEYYANSFLAVVSTIFSLYSGIEEGISEDVPCVCVVKYRNNFLGGLYYEGKVMVFQQGGFLVFNKKRIVKSWVVQNG